VAEVDQHSPSLLDRRVHAFQAKPAAPPRARLSTWSDDVAGGRVGKIVQLIQKGFGHLKAGGIEAFGEPAVYVGEHFARFLVPTPLFTEAGQAYRCSEFPGFAQLEPRRSDRPAEVFFGVPIL
jgi:hypothetical protein